MTDTKAQLGAVNKRLLGMFKAEQKTMMAFKGLSDSATRAGTVPSAMKEAIATAIAVATGCDDCIVFHVAAAKGHGLERAQLTEVLGVAVEMAGGPGAVYAAKALEAFDGL